MKCFKPISFLLLVIGGINWLLIGAFDFNLVNIILGNFPMLEKIAYILVGVSALLCIPSCTTMCSGSYKKK